MRLEFPERTALPDDSLKALGAPELDPARYADHLNDFEMSEAQKLELLQALWSIMRSFVEMGLDAKNCGQLAVDLLLASPERDPGVDSIPDESGKRGAP